ncbi:MAG: hypothetical protein ACLF0P_17130, partial [Thermoanaerobaculia bacterium]
MELFFSALTLALLVLLAGPTVLSVLALRAARRLDSRAMDLELTVARLERTLAGAGDSGAPAAERTAPREGATAPAAGPPSPPPEARELRDRKVAGWQEPVPGSAQARSEPEAPPPSPPE